MEVIQTDPATQQLDWMDIKEKIFHLDIQMSETLGHKYLGK